MEVEILSSKDINKEKWNELIYTSQEGNIFATYDYLQHCEREWKAVVLFNKAGSYQAGLPFQVRRMYGIEYIYQDPFCRELGLFTKRNLLEDELTHLLQTSLMSYKYVASYNFNVCNNNIFSEANRFPSQYLSTTATYHLNLNKSYKEIEQGFNTNRKRELKKAIKSKLELECTEDIEDGFQLFTKYTFHKIKGVEYYQIDLLKKLYNNLISDGLLKVYYACFKKRRVSTAFYVHYKNRLVYIFGANDNQALKVGASTFLHAEVIKKYACSELVLDFEGGDDSNLAYFYKSFGAKKKTITLFKRNDLPIPFRVVMWTKRLLYHYIGRGK